MVAGTLCGDGSEIQVLCTNSLFSLLGFNEKEMNASLIPVIAGHTPAGSSTKQLIHYGQLHRSGEFRQYDYGSFYNLWKYGEWNSPRYELRNVMAPVFLYYSRNDWMSNEIDVLKLANELGNLKAKFLVSDRSFNHMDYLYGIETPTILYAKIIWLLKNH